MGLLHTLKPQICRMTYREQWCLYDLSELLDLLLAPTNVRVCYVGLLLDLHHRDRGINLWWQWYLDLVLVAVDARYGQLVSITDARADTTHPTRIPSSISVGATRSPRPTTNLAICLMLMTYLSCSSAPFWP